SLTISIPACTCSCNDKRNASCLASCNSSPCNFHGDQSFSGSASQDVFGKLPAVEVGNNNFMYSVFYISFKVSISLNSAACFRQQYLLKQHGFELCNLQPIAQESLDKA